MRTVEIFSRTDSVIVADRKVWYWAEYEGVRFKEVNEWKPVNDFARAIYAKHSEVGTVDRSDKESGFLLATLDDR